jgi:hypothetical protein
MAPTAAPLGCCAAAARRLRQPSDAACLTAECTCSITASASSPSSSAAAASPAPSAAAAGSARSANGRMRQMTTFWMRAGVHRVTCSRLSHTCTAHAVRSRACPVRLTRTYQKGPPVTTRVLRCMRAERRPHLCLVSHCKLLHDCLGHAHMPRAHIWVSIHRDDRLRARRGDAVVVLVDGACCAGLEACGRCQLSADERCRSA